MSDFVACANCRWHSSVGSYYTNTCNRPEDNPDKLIDGNATRPIRSDCRAERREKSSLTGRCGIDGRYFEPKLPEPKKGWRRWLRK